MLIFVLFFVYASTGPHKPFTPRRDWVRKNLKEFAVLVIKHEEKNGSYPKSLKSIGIDEPKFQLHMENQGKTFLVVPTYPIVYQQGVPCFHACNNKLEFLQVPIEHYKVSLETNEEVVQ